MQWGQSKSVILLVSVGYIGVLWRGRTGPRMVAELGEVKLNDMMEIKEVIIPDGIGALCEFERRAFHVYPNDVYDAEDWKEVESYWMIVDGETVGCTAFDHNIDYDDRPRPGCLYISSTSVLPEFQGQGFGKKQKEWQIEYAKQNGFQVIVTNMRQSNERIIGLNERFGFQRRKTVPGYYTDPSEPAVLLCLIFQQFPTPSPPSRNPLRTPRANQCRLWLVDWH